MPLPPHDLTQLRAAAATAGAALTVADGADADEAFDAAVAAAYNDPTHAAAFTTADPGAVQVIDGTYTLDTAVAAAVAWARDHATAADLAVGDEAGDGGGPVDRPVAAFAVVGRSAHTRTTRRARLEGVHFEVDGTAAAPWVPLTDEVAAAVADADAGPAAGEVLERVTVTRRARYKPVAEAHKGASAAQFVAVADGRILVSGQPTATAARREAVALVKALPHDDHQGVHIEVFKLVGRDEGRPLATVTRDRVRQTLTLKLTYAAAKESAKPPKVVGWVFVTPDH